MPAPVLLKSETAGGACWTITLNRPRANILDMEMCGFLTGVFAAAESARGLKAVCLTHAGEHFSFGASVEEHRLGKVGDMLPKFHDLFRAMAAASVPVLAAVRGNCLGGGLELLSFCHRVFGDETVRMGQPEIRLGVFAPVASLLLPGRIGRAAAEDLCLTGRVVGAQEALSLGLLDELVADPLEAAYAYFDRGLAPHSASSLRFANNAVRAGLYPQLFGDLEILEQDYLSDLMRTDDAVEGIAAFLEKRSPRWRNS